MSKQHLKAIGTTDTWIAPKYITEALGRFDLDPCEHLLMPWKHANKGYTINDDGLKQDWNGRVWMNPPFNQYHLPLWMDKFVQHKNGIVLMAFTGETKRFKDYVWGKATGILIMDHRPYFRLPNGEKGKSNSGQTMCLISYDQENLEALFESKLGIVTNQIFRY